MASLEIDKLKQSARQELESPWPDALMSRPINQGDSWVEHEGEMRQGWLLRDAGAEGGWKLVLMNEQDARDLAIAPAERILADALQPDIGAPLEWHGNQSATDTREPPENLSFLFYIDNGDDYRFRFDPKYFELVRTDGSGAAEIIEPQENALFPPDAFDPRTGVLRDGYRLRLNPENTLAEKFTLPEGSIVDGYINIQSNILFYEGDPKEGVRFNLAEQGFLTKYANALPPVDPALLESVEVMRSAAQMRAPSPPPSPPIENEPPPVEESHNPEGIGLSPIDKWRHIHAGRGGVFSDMASAFNDAAAPRTGFTFEKAHYYNFADEIGRSITAHEGGLESVVADFKENGIEAFPFTPILDGRGLIKTVQENGAVKTAWENAEGQEVLFSPEEVGAQIESLIFTYTDSEQRAQYFEHNPNVEPAVNMLAVALNQSAAIENGEMSPSINLDQAAPEIEEPINYDDNRPATTDSIKI